MSAAKTVDPRIAAIVAAAPPLTAESCSAIAALGKAIADTNCGKAANRITQDSRRAA